MYALLLLVAFVGHGFLWIGLVNRLHALGARRRVIKSLTVVALAIGLLLPMALALSLLRKGCFELPYPSSFTTWGWLGGFYAVACVIVAPLTLVRAAYLHFIFRRPPAILRSHRRQPAVIDLPSAAQSADELRHHCLVRLPFNEVLRPDLAEWVLDVPRMVSALDRLSIVHLSDFHLTGRIGKAYFREVVRIANELQPDLIFVTGDLLDAPRYMAWVPDTIGQLQARHGVFFVLGNHDRRVDHRQLRRDLEQHGQCDLGASVREIEINGARILMAGNEQPWFAGGQSAPLPPASPEGPLRIALAHSPDQLPWARRSGADLLFTGHTHGGQIRIPPLGPIFSPTIEGVKYISGIFHVPPTILHVSRGISGDTPVRWNCPPEITHLRLRSSQT